MPFQYILLGSWYWAFMYNLDHRARYCLLGVDFSNVPWFGAHACALHEVVRALLPNTSRHSASLRTLLRKLWLFLCGLCYSTSAVCCGLSLLVYVAYTLVYPRNFFYPTWLTAQSSRARLCMATWSCSTCIHSGHYTGDRRPHVSLSCGYLTCVCSRERSVGASR